MINSMVDASPEVLLLVLGFLMYNFHYLLQRKSIIVNIIITSFVLAVFDVFLKNILLMSVDNNYYKFVINNVITIVVIDYLIYFIKGDSESKTIYTYMNLAFACLFYEMIVFKLYNYNNLCNQKLRSMTKTIMRLATIHIFSNYLDQKPYNQDWFNFSFGQIFNFSLFDIVFVD
ncbi:MAG: hypothetical protein Gaeavirus8_16 [Gaeavirus sp.]|uniref:Uncharacterized protein n=1 Tax=Gaeavirus sp. TaxID=2487767 RepID=A0A3G4ZYU1_9VIRU|nr:MAG: hypothetical protein Gaeavirus8_16 [Gaeavirus sp.]